MYRKGDLIIGDDVPDEQIQDMLDSVSEVDLEAEIRSFFNWMHGLMYLIIGFIVGFIAGWSVFT